MTQHSRPVYSTQTGRLCPDCGQPQAACRCKRAHKSTPPPIGDGIIRIHREKSGRGGKEVSLIKGLPLTHDALTALAKELKAKCGTGGTVKDAVIEIQGDHRERLKGMLEAKGYVVKLAGG